MLDLDLVRVASKIVYGRARNLVAKRRLVARLGCRPNRTLIRVVCDTKVCPYVQVDDWGYAVSTGLVYIYKRSRIFAYYGALGRVAVVHLLYA